MKIIKQADPKEWSYKYTCKECTSELEVQSSDLKHTHVSGYYNERSYDTFSCTCPVCSNSFEISSDNIPKIVKLEAKKRSGK